MRAGTVWRAMFVGALAMGVLGACSDDDDDTGSATNTTAEADGGAGGGTNELKIEMVDYGYKVTGSLKSGLTTITSTNTGTEWHMAGLGKLKDGATVEELTAALQASDESSEEDPTAEFIEQQLDTPGHILQPGSTQSLTVDVLDAGTYVMMCFLPTEGEGTPHFAKGMIGSFTVADEDSGTREPAADAEITLDDEADPTGLTELASGKRTFKVTSSGAKGKDFTLAQLNEGKAFEDFDTYFESEFEREGGPSKGAAANAPGRLLASTFEIQPGQSIWVTVDIPKGDTYVVSTTNSDSEDGDEATVDKFVKVTAT